MPVQGQEKAPLSFRAILSPSLLGVLFALLVEAAFNGLVPLSVRFFLDRALALRGSAAPDRSVLVLMAIVLAAGAAIAVATGLLRDLLAVGVQTRSLSILRQRIFERLQFLSLTYQSPVYRTQRDSFEATVREGPARLNELPDRLSEDFATLEKTVRQTIPWGLLPAMEALLSTGLMFWLDWRAGLAGLVFWPWIILAPGAASGRAGKVGEELGKEESRLNGFLRENVAAQALIRAFSLEQMGIRNFRKRNDVWSRTMARAERLSAFMERFTGAGILGVQTFLLLQCAWLTFGKQMTAGTFVAVQILAVTLSNSLLFTTQYLPSLVSAHAAWRRIATVLGSEPTVKDRPDARLLPPLRAEIILSHVSFRYAGTSRDAREPGHGTENDLTDINAHIARGAYVAFVGPSGAGKTTLLNLLMRFHDPAAGFIAVDGHDLRSLTQASLRSRIGVVLQETAVFGMSLRENIRVGRPEASEDAVVEAARAVGLHEFILALPQGYETPVGEGGALLPVAEMQRLAIARAILKDPEILLLDEATSALDPADEIAVNSTLRQLAKGRTTISFTHRLSTAADADHIFMLGRGRILEQGSHYELMALDGVYAGLWRKQAGFTFSKDGRHVDVDARRLKAFPILDNLDEATLAELAPFFATESFAPGREIVRQNDPGDKFYIVARGAVEVWRTEEHSGFTRRVAVLQAGDFFGEITLITGFPRTATVRTLTSCTCISLERGKFDRMLDRFPELRSRMSETAVRRLRESSKAIDTAIFAGQ